MPAILEVEHLSTQLRLPDRTVYAVDDVSFSVGAGEAVGLVGESGSGKTMTGASLLQVLPEGGEIVDGSIRLDGEELVGLPSDALRKLRGGAISMVAQDPMTSLDPTMRIGRQVAEPMIIHGTVPKNRLRARVLELLELVGIPRPEERIDAFPHQLSGGLRQRVCIAMALACDPKVLIADEPTTALDVSVQDQILSLLQRLRRELGMALLLITHDMGVIAEHADRVLVMYAGRIIEAAGTVGLFEQTRHPYTEALLGALPRVDQTSAEALYNIAGSPPSLTAPNRNCPFHPRCRYATDECRQTIPPLDRDRTGHSWECFHPRDGREVRPALEPTAAAAAKSADVLVAIDDIAREFPLRGALGRRSSLTVKAVSGVSFEIFRGETLGLVGESGCGKTTVGRMLVGLEEPDSGEIFFDGRRVTVARSTRERRRRSRDVQMIFQDPYASLDPRMRIRGILDEPLAVQRTHKRDERLQRIRQLLREVGLEDAAAGLLPREFSGGQRQRIGFARALALQPRLIVADEPVSALDVSIRAQLLNLMRRLQIEHDLTYLMISHDLSVVRYLADRVAVMYLGKLVEIGPTAAIYGGPAHPYTAGLLEAVPVPDPQRRAARERVAVRGELPSSIDPPSGCRFRTRCPRAQDLCAEQEPPLIPFGPLHTAACHFPLREPVDAEPAAASS